MTPAHQAALGAVLVDPDNAALILDRLTAADFDPGWYQLVYTAIAEIHSEAGTPDAQAILGRLTSLGRIRTSDGGIGPFIAELYEAATIPTTPERHIAAVLEHSYRRQLWDATTRIRQAITEWPIEAIKATVDRELTSAMQAAARLTPVEPVSTVTVGLPGLADILGGFVESPAA